MQRSYIVFSLAVLLLSTNLRALIVAIGPLMSTIRDAIGANATVMGIIGTLPVLTFAACSPFAARLARRFGLEDTILAGIALIALGSIIRSLFANEWSIMLGTIILCAGITMGNVLLAAVIKRDQPERIAQMTALQMFAFGILSALAAALAVPLSERIGWQWALGIWGVMAFPAFLLWLHIRIKRGNESLAYQQRKTPVTNVWHSPLAWKISIFTGVQSMLFYTFVAWLATILTARGISATDAGYYNTLFQLIVLPTSLLISPLVERYKNMSHLLMGSTLLILIGTLGIWYAPISLLWLSTAFLGIGSCASFTLCLMLFAIRGKTPEQSGALSGMGQTIGYAIAAFGPVCTGWLYDLSHHWYIPMYAIITVICLQLILAVPAGRAENL